MYEMGSPLVRFEDTQESAWKVVAQLLGESTDYRWEEQDTLIPYVVSQAYSILGLIARKAISYSSSRRKHEAP